MVILGFIISSVIYINNQKTLWSIYQFGVVNIFMVCILSLIKQTQYVIELINYFFFITYVNYYMTLASYKLIQIHKLHA